MNAIHVDGLTREFGDLTAVDDLSFSVEAGELFGLLGPNGAGKSTLIKMLVTLLQPSSGTASVNGYDIRTDRGGVRNSLGIVFQEPALDGELTGAENLALHARMYGQRKRDRDERIDEVLELVDLTDERDVLVENYSGGMKRRLEIGRGLMHEPSVLFLDEPTAGLDARARRDTWTYIQEMNDRSGITIVLTTHYIEEAEHLCDRVAIVDHGEIVALDTPDALTASLGGDVVTLELEGETGPFLDALERTPWVSEYQDRGHRQVQTDDRGRDPHPEQSDDRDREENQDQNWNQEHHQNPGQDPSSTVHVTLNHGESRIADLVRLADEAAVQITSIDLRKPNLESVFLSLTGSTFDERETAGPRDTADASTAGSGPSSAASEGRR